jgi:hypothetical protein
MEEKIEPYPLFFFVLVFFFLFHGLPRCEV